MPVEGSHPASSATSVSPSCRRTCRPSSRPTARTIVNTASVAKTTPLAGRRRPWTCTIAGPAASIIDASASEIDERVVFVITAIVTRPGRVTHHPNGGDGGFAGSRVLQVLGFYRFSGSTGSRVLQVLGFYRFSGSTGSDSRSA